MPSYFTQRLSRRLLSLVQVADQPGGRGQVGAALGLGVGWAGTGVLGAFASLAGQVWYHSFTGDKVSITQVSIAQVGIAHVGIARGSIARGSPQGCPQGRSGPYLSSWELPGCSQPCRGSPGRGSGS